ncbi:hypothetical protein BFC18_04330 [Alteromonas confluentis]|uniref:Uncharacterized protein n=2 Tax=Alteromonas confluentis TaxID=1656094 RepID=A0A1E7ZFB5_9ALTE|nr:hypothetical protein BFC18_04330 [Alteromonas confluentis]
MITTNKAKKLLVPTLIIAIAILVYCTQYFRITPPPSKGLGNQCEFVNLHCSIVMKNDNIEAEFAQLPVVEESITVNLSLPLSKQVQSIWIEGVNMYMGKIPVLAEQQDNGDWSGWFMLGSCSEPTMRWKMLIHVENEETPYVMFFETKMP